MSCPGSAHFVPGNVCENKFGLGGDLGGKNVDARFSSPFFEIILGSILGFAPVGAPFLGNLFFVSDFVRWDKGVVGIVLWGNGENKRAPLLSPLFLMCRSTQVGDRRWCCRCQRGVGRNARPPDGFEGFARGWDGAGETGDIWLNISPLRVHF